MLDDKIKWHPALYSAVRHELKEFADSLTFQEEYQLNVEPLIIDLLIIKKPPEVEITKSIGRISRNNLCLRRRVSHTDHKQP